MKRDPSTKKSGAPYDPDPYVITRRKETMITAKKKGTEITRNSSCFKPVDPVITVDLEDTDDEEIHPNPSIPDAPTADDSLPNNDDSETRIPNDATQREVREDLRIISKIMCKDYIRYYS